MPLAGQRREGMTMAEITLDRIDKTYPNGFDALHAPGTKKVPQAQRAQMGMASI